MTQIVHILYISDIYQFLYTSFFLFFNNYKICCDKRFHPVKSDTDTFPSFRSPSG